ncbi:unnamed protein product [Chrysoparadoxa australica]
MAATIRVIHGVTRSALLQRKALLHGAGLQKMPRMLGYRCLSQGSAGKFKVRQEEEVELYTGDGKLRCRLMNGGAILHAGYWTWYCSYFRVWAEGIGAGADPIWGQVGAFVSVIFLASVRAYSSKYVSHLSYLPRFNSLRVSGYGWTGAPTQPRDVPLTEVVVGKGSNVYQPFKLENDALYMLLDNVHGKWEVDKDTVLYLMKGDRDAIRLVGDAAAPEEDTGHGARHRGRRGRGRRGR